MSTPAALIGGALIGAAAGAVMVPFTRRELAASLARAGDADHTLSAAAPVPTTPDPRITTRQWAALAVVSGLLPAYVLHRVGWSVIAIPPLLLLIGLIQLAYCDLARRLLPKTLVWALTTAVIVSGVVIAGVMHEWERLLVATVGGLALFTVFFVINLMNPRWMGFGDVRLSLVVGFGLAWVGATALLEGFFLANALGAFAGLFLMATHRADRDHAVPFGLYLALATAIVLLTWA